MKLHPTIHGSHPGLRPHRAQHASILIIVLWIAFGLITLALYFAHSMTFEMRAAEHRTAAAAADSAIAGAALYVSNILASVSHPGQLPDPLTYATEAVPVGDARFWLIGRETNASQLARARPVFDLIDESAKLNLNTATAEMLECLPGMTPELAAAIVDWRDADSEPSLNGAEDQSYQRLVPPRHCKNANFDSVDELRLVFGMQLDILRGEDANHNGLLDPNENDGETSSPFDNRDGRLDPGISEFLTVWSGEANAGRTNLNNPQQLAAVLQNALGTDRANQVLLAFAGQSGRPGGQGRPGGGNTNLTLNCRSLLEFYVRSGLTADEFSLVETNLTASTNAFTPGLVNVNTATETVLACIPGIGPEKAPALVAARQSTAARHNSIAWLREVLDDESALQAGPYLTAHSFQFTADIAAVGQYGRGYQRTRFVFDTDDGTPRVVYRQDLTHLGWALGTDARKTWSSPDHLVADRSALSPLLRP